jgi:regulator of sigma D
VTWFGSNEQIGTWFAARTHLKEAFCTIRTMMIAVVLNIWLMR